MNAATTALPALQFLANTAQNHPGLGKALLAAMTSLASSNQPSTITPNGALNTSASPNPTTQPLPGSNLCDLYVPHFSSVSSISTIDLMTVLQSKAQVP